MDSCWFREIGAEKDVWQCHNRTAKTGTGIWLDNNDHSIANVVVYCSLSGAGHLPSCDLRSLLLLLLFFSLCRSLPFSLYSLSHSSILNHSLPLTSCLLLFNDVYGLMFICRHGNQRKRICRSQRTRLHRGTVLTPEWLCVRAVGCELYPICTCTTCPR